MSTHKHIDIICIVIAVLALLLTVLFMNGNALGIISVSKEENSNAVFTENDLNAQWDTSNATKITLSDSGSTISGNGAYENGGNIYIVYAGKYVISGELSNGKILIDADGDDKIWLMLSGASIHCEDDAAIRIEQAGKVFLTLKDGTENALSSGAAYSEDAVLSGVDGVIYSRDDLTVNGNGSLNVTAEYKHGIVCNDDLVITGGTITVKSSQDGFHAHDSVRIKDADITITAGDDGITASNDDETAYFYMESGKISIPSCYEGIEAIQITIAGGTVDISPSDDGINANGNGRNSVLNITGGDITIKNENGRDADGIDSNKDIYISGGKLFISVGNNGGNSAIDYGSENGGVCVISGGTVLACGSSSMAESFDSSSTQGFLMQTASAEAGTTVTVKDSDGKVLLSETVPYSFSSVLVSTPDMKIGDTCTLVIGETETEMTVDNSSTSGGFGGGFGGGRMPDGNANGFGGKNGGGMFGGKGNRQMQNSEAEQKSMEKTGDSPTVSYLSTVSSETQNRNSAGQQMPPDKQDGNAGAPEMPNGENGYGMRPNFPQGEMNDGKTPPELPQGEINEDGEMPEPPQGEMNNNGELPELPQGETNGNGTQSDIPQGNQGFGGRFDGGNMQKPNDGNMQNQGNEMQTENNGSNISSDTVLLVCLSALVLLIGCIVAFFYKQRV